MRDTPFPFPVLPSTNTGPTCGLLVSSLVDLMDSPELFRGRAISEPAASAPSAMRLARLSESLRSSKQGPRGATRNPPRGEGD